MGWHAIKVDKYHPDTQELLMITLQGLYILLFVSVFVP